MVVAVSLTLNARRPDGSVFPEGALVTVKFDRTVSASDLVVPDPAAVPVVVTQDADPVLEVPYASDDPAVDPASQGFGLIVTARWVQDGTPQSWTRTYGLTVADGSTPNLSSLGLLVAASTPNLVQGPRGPAGPAGSGASNTDVAGYISSAGATQSALNTQVDAHLGGDSTKIAPMLTSPGNGYVWGTSGTGTLAWSTSQATVARALGWTIATDAQYAGADDGATLRNAIAAAGNGGTIWLGAGKTWTVPDAASSGSVITLLPYQALRAGRQMLGAASGSSPSKIIFPNISGTAIGITGAGSCTVSELSVFGPDVTAWTTSTVGMQFGGSGYSGSAVTLEDCSFQGFGVGTYFAGQYYVSATRCEWKNNQKGLTADSCYTINLFAPKFTCSNGDTTKFGTGINVTNGGRGPINVFGGTIENYGNAGGITLGTNNITLNLDGVYFESSQAASGNNTGVSSISRTGNVINANGCLVMLAQHRSWIETTGSTNGALNSGGNTFVCSSSTTPATPIAYLFSNPAGLDILLGMGAVDSWAAVTVGTYSSSPGTGRVWRNLPAAAGGTTTQLGRNLQMSSGQVIYLGNGATTSRPTGLSGSPAIWYDITLGKPIFWTGTKWVLADGTNA